MSRKDKGAKPAKPDASLLALASLTARDALAQNDEALAEQALKLAEAAFWDAGLAADGTGEQEQPGPPGSGV